MSLFQSPTVYSLLSCVQQNHYLCAQSYASAPAATSSNRHGLFWVASRLGLGIPLTCSWVGVRMAASSRRIAISKPAFPWRIAVEKQGRETIPVDQLAMTNANIMVALLDLLEEKGVVRKDEVWGRVKLMREEVRK